MTVMLGLNLPDVCTGYLGLFNSIFLLGIVVTVTGTYLNLLNQLNPSIRQMLER